MTNFYEEDYRKLFYSKSPASAATNLIHRALEKRHRKNHFSKVLEIGGGEGFHVRHVQHSFDHYYLSDIEIRPLDDFAEDLKTKEKLTHIRKDSADLGFNDESFDRVILMCVLHHLPEIEKSLFEARRVTRTAGVVSIYLPCDPGLMYRFARFIFTNSRSKKLGIDYPLVNAREHRNHFNSINKILKHVFAQDDIVVRRSPFVIPSWNLNFYYIINISKRPA